MSYLEELLPEFRKGAKIRRKNWSKEVYIYLEGDGIYNRNNELIGKFIDFDILLKGDWELYQKPEFDWDYIIKNNCLCKFWDDEDESKTDIKTFGLLKHYNPDSDEPFCMKFAGYWRNCRPVRRDEVTFYEDRE